MSEISDLVVQLLDKKKIDLTISLPCDKLRSFLATLPSDKHFSVTREACGVGIAAGVHLAGGRAILAMQNTGLGNALIDLISLNKIYRIPLPILASWRGGEEETIEAQKAFGAITDKLLEATGIPYAILSRPTDRNEIGRMIDIAYKNRLPTVCLIHPRFWGKLEEIALRARFMKWPQENLKTSVTSNKLKMTRYQAIEAIVSGIVKHDPDALIVCNLGIPSKELYALSEGIREHSKNFYMLGSFGEVSAIGLGIAMFSDKNVYSLDGDGSVLHNPNVLDAIVRAQAKNFTLFCLDNGVYSSTGNQMSPSNTIDLEHIALAYGFTAKTTTKVLSKEEIESVIKNKKSGPRFIHAVLLSGNAEVKDIMVPCAEIKANFMNHLVKTDDI